jgi:hypothetical protein
MSIRAIPKEEKVTGFVCTHCKPSILYVPGHQLFPFSKRNPMALIIHLAVTEKYYQQYAFLHDGFNQKVSKI